MRSRLFAALMALGLVVAVHSQTVAVAAAANLSGVEVPLRQAFARAHPGGELRFTFAASGTLVNQITHGAPFDVFLSADRGYAQRLVDAGWSQGPVRIYAVGKLIVLSLRPLDPVRGLASVLDPAVGQIAIANPETAPYGRAAVEALTRAGLYDRVRSKLVTGQNITQALQFTLAATDFGFVSRSALASPETAPYREEGTFWFEVDPALYSPIEQGFVVHGDAERRPEVGAFVQFLGSAEAHAVFAAFGYGAP